MKRALSLISLLIVPFLVGCNKNSTDMPKSPFKDHYKRIGMEGEFAKTGTMNQAEYNDIKTYINAQEDPTQTDTDNLVSSYHRQEEIRDLKYAYFGKESSTISRCSMTSHSETLTRYSNNVFINKDITDKQIQTANGGIQKTKSTVTDYIFDDEYKEDTLAETYSERISTMNNEEKEKITEPQTNLSYSSDEVFDIFGLKPFTKRIKSHFTPDESTGYNFKLLANENDAVYFKSKDKFLIKEGYSLFSNFHTTMGRSYKAQDNYFYEGLLEQKDKKYRFTNFRFYHELVILSKSYDGVDVPILYLDRPVIIEYSEVVYSDIKYDTLTKYTGNVPPKPTNI